MAVQSAIKSISVRSYERTLLPICSDKPFVYVALEPVPVNGAALSTEISSDVELPVAAPYTHIKCGIFNGTDAGHVKRVPLSIPGLREPPTLVMAANEPEPPKVPYWSGMSHDTDPLG
jgi:hypothetical protein